MNAVKKLGPAVFVLSLTAVLLSFASLPAEANLQVARQYFNKHWQKKGGYYYRLYTYQAMPNGGYKHHYVVYYPVQPRYYYYFNPYSRKYWGRFDREERKYSRLAMMDQGELLNNIPVAAFPPPGPMPTIPEANDGTRMAEPGFDGPPDEPIKPLPPPRVKELMPNITEQEPPRQVYTGWCKYDGHFSCGYYCQPKPAADYVVHKCIYYPAQPKYIYYFNPTKGKYWGRYDLTAQGYSLLAENDRASKLEDIPEAAFPMPGEMPPFPGATDGTRMIKPAQELPV